MCVKRFRVAHACLLIKIRIMGTQAVAFAGGGISVILILLAAVIQPSNGMR